jgi:2-polyprenyl-6-methoxyphenol hydroxylase-like FAD-dependent oxidoreductase
MERSVDVAIVGGGPAGLVLALLLARSGRSAVVVEQNATFAREYRGEGLQPGTRRIFADLGLRERIEALDRGAPHGLLARIDGKEMRLDFASFLGNDPGARSIFVPQPLLLETLAEAASSASATISMATRFKALRSTAGRVEGIDVVDEQGRDRFIPARLVVACDGRFSAVRRAAAVDVRTTNVGYDLLWFSARAPTQTNDLVYLHVASEELAVAFPSRGKLMQVGWLIAKDTPRPSRDELIARAPPEARPSIAAEWSGSERVAFLPIASETIDRWSQPGLLFVGDAAHPMSPVGAQGVNVAVQDAVVAARHLVRALDDRGSLDEALGAIERERTASVRRIARQQNMLPSAFRRFGAARTLHVAIVAAANAQRAGLFPLLGARFLDRFLWGDPPIRADSGPWSDWAKDSCTKTR